MSLTFSPLGPGLDEALDGPAWDGGGLLFCVPGRNEIHRWDETTGATSVVRSATNRTRGLALGGDGRLFGAQSRARRVMWLSADGGAFYLEAMLDGERHNDPQDLVVDAGSRVWFTDRHTDSTIPGPVGYAPLAHNSVLRLEESVPRELAPRHRNQQHREPAAPGLAAPGLAAPAPPVDGGSSG